MVWCTSSTFKKRPQTKLKDRAFRGSAGLQHLHQVIRRSKCWRHEYLLSSRMDTYTIGCAWVLWHHALTPTKPHRCLERGPDGQKLSVCEQRQTAFSSHSSDHQICGAAWSLQPSITPTALEKAWWIASPANPPVTADFESWMTFWWIATTSLVTRAQSSGQLDIPITNWNPGVPLLAGQWIFIRGGCKSGTPSMPLILIQRHCQGVSVQPKIKGNTGKDKLSIFWMLWCP